MTDEKRQEYTLRITQANQSQLVVILYDLFFEYTGQAVEELSKGNRQAYSEQLDRAQDVLSELILSLNMDQDPAPAIYRVYLYVSARIGQARGSLKSEGLKDPLRMMHSLCDTYREDAKSDTSGPVMDNSQKVYAGLTYGRDSLNESMDEGSGSRGFFV
ncbi:MAG: flagellar protein FliS [Lachnospiraceae bacterium]|nr:flagellar protein FliS [Lachnospiraceae bacterium]